MDFHKSGRGINLLGSAPIIIMRMDYFLIITPDRIFREIGGLKSGDLNHFRCRQ